MELADRIIHAWRHKGLVTAFIYGQFGDGKTSYLLHTAQEVFKRLENLSTVEAWYRALDHLFLSPVEGMAYIETQRSKDPDSRVVMLGMDDVGQHLPRARWWREDVVQFREWLTVARTDAAAVVFTAPTQLSLPGGIIDACFIRVHVEKSKEPRYSLAKGYTVFVTPYFQQRVSGPVFMDEFPTHYPDYVFMEYTQIRKDAVAPLRRHLIKTWGMDETIEALHHMGMSQKAIGDIVGKDNSTIGKRLKKMAQVESKH